MSALVAALYCLCLLFLTGFTVFVLIKDPHSRTHRHFAWLLLALLGWVASLFAFNLETSPAQLLWLGRFNFAAIVFAVTLGYAFVCDVARRRPVPAPAWLWAETAGLAALTLLTPLVDRAELVVSGLHVTLYGPLFPLYLLHVLALLGAALFVAFRPPQRLSAEVKSQLRLIGIGGLATGAVALVTNVLLPYAFGDFALIHVGTLSTILFLAAVGDAVFVHHLFDVRVVLRAAFVYAGLVALALELYQLALSFLAHLLPLGNAAERTYAATALVLVVNAFTQRPLKRWLERLIDRLGSHKGAHGSR